MKLEKTAQAALLKLCEVDLEIAHIRQEIAKAIDSAELTQLRKTQTEIAGELIAARSEVENLEAAQRRADDDLHLVEERIAKDKSRLSTTSSPKDAQGLQSEIESLERRKSELEDVELAVLAELETSRVTLTEISNRKESNTLKLEQLQESIQLEIDELKNRGRKLSADREILVGKISTEVITRYQSLATRAIAVGQIQERSCSACRMGLTANVIDAIRDLPEDELGTCPECQAFLVR